MQLTTVLLSLLPGLAIASNHEMAAPAGVNIEDVANQLGVVVEAPMHEAPASAAAAAAPMVHSSPPEVLASMVHTTAGAPEMMHTTAAAAAPEMIHTTAAAAAPEIVNATGAAALLAEAPTEVAAAAGAIHTVHVGGKDLVFNPTEVIAAVGDTVTFIFLAKNHTVTQSTFESPCVKSPEGEDSGFMPNPSGDAAKAPTFDFIVGDMKPSWWYCKQKQPKPHCGAGMVFAINPTAEKSFEIFQAAAKAGAAAGTDTAAAAELTGAPLTLSVDNGGVTLTTSSVIATNVVAAPVATETVVAPGWNAQGNAQACNCACFCGVGSFPDGDGVGAYGGYSGSLPAPWG